MTPSSDPSSPATGSHPGYPTRTKVIIVVVLSFAAVLFIVAAFATDTERDDELAVTGVGDGAVSSLPVPVTIAPGVESRRPRDGAEVLAQEAITLDLAAGWTGELVLEPDNGDAIPLPAAEVDSNSLGELVYRPAPGRTIERLPSGRVCVRATIWDQVRGRAASERVETWCFDVT